MGPLHQISIVGTVKEEVGGYLKELLQLLEEDPFLHQVPDIDIINPFGLL